MPPIAALAGLPLYQILGKDGEGPRICLPVTEFYRPTPLTNNSIVLMRLAKICFVFAVAALSPWLTGLSGTTPGDYQRELAQIESKISQTRDASGQFSGSPDTLLKNAYYYFLKASLTGSERDMAQAAFRFDRVAQSQPDAPEFYLLRAAFDLKRHRLAAAKTGLERISFLKEDPKYRVLMADIDAQQGNYRGASIAYQGLIERNPQWDTLARLAYLRWKAGDFASAEQLYSQAEELLSAKDMRSYAWLELQKGLMALSRGRDDAAWSHYQRAEQAYSGYWLVKEYMAEWWGAQRRFEEAVALYRKLIACAPKAEYYQALGDLFLLKGKTELARPWHDKALAKYLESAGRGEVHYYHHLAAFYADVRQDGAEAVKWAQKDLALRKNAATYDAMAWALYRNGQYADAVAAMIKALAGNWRDAHLYFHAAMVYLAVGRITEGKDYLKKAAAINPHYDRFHVHR